MDTEKALRVVSRQAPCPHDNADTTLGNGKVWARCEDCGVTFPQEYWENAKAAAKSFDDAIETIRNAMTPNTDLGEGRERGILREASSGEAATSTDGLCVGGNKEKA